MSRAFIRQVNVGLGVTLLLLLLNALVSYRSISRLINNERQVSQSHQTIAELEATLSTLKDAETGQRGYLLTGRDRYLEPYNTAIAQTNQQVQRLRQQISPALQPQIQTLSQLVDTRLVELNRTIQIRRSRGLDAALREVETDRGKRIMDEIRRQVAAIEQVEQQLIQRQRESQRSIQSTLLTFIGVTGASLLLGLVGTVLRRGSDLQRRAEQKLSEREERLRLFVRYAPVSVAMFDRSMRYLAVSQRWVEEYHLESIQAILGKSHYEVFPNIPDYWRQVHQRALAGQPEKCEDDRFILLDGTEQYLRWEVQPWFKDLSMCSKCWRVKFRSMGWKSDTLTKIDRLGLSYRCPDARGEWTAQLFYFCDSGHFAGRRAIRRSAAAPPAHPGFARFETAPTTGAEGLNWLRQQPILRRIPVVVLTSSREYADINRIYDLGVNAYIVKPVQFDVLAEIMQTLNLHWLVLNENPQILGN